MPIAETERLVLRLLLPDDLPVMAALLGDWEVIRWLTVMPFPFTFRDAEELYRDLDETDASGAPSFLALQTKNDPRLIGGIALQPPREPGPLPGEVELGYWLGREYWGRGLMTEAVVRALALAFARPATELITATAEPENSASQQVLQHAGLQAQGRIARPYSALRGGDTVLAWQITRAGYEAVHA